MNEKNFNFCPYCGKRLPKFNNYKTNYCCYCGKKLKKDTEKLIGQVQCTICHRIIDPNRNLTIICSYCGSVYHSTCVYSWLLKYNA
ncbi:MAG: hypothetical protein ACFE9M_07305, partial [Promethearchaeota archaeon]